MKPWAKQFYSSAAWHRCKNAYLKSVHGICERCKANGNIVPAKIVHHKKHLCAKTINNPHLSLSWQNLEALCQQCHNAEHHSKSSIYKIDDNGMLILNTPPTP